MTLSSNVWPNFQFPHVRFDLMYWNNINLKHSNCVCVYVWRGEVKSKKLLRFTVREYIIQTKTCNLILVRRQIFGTRVHKYLRYRLPLAMRMSETGLVRHPWGEGRPMNDSHDCELVHGCPKRVLTEKNIPKDQLGYSHTHKMAYLERTMQQGL